MISILVIDDHPLVGDGISMMVKEITHLQILTVCKTGKEALVFLEKTSPDVILLDISLPDIDGLEATRRIRASEANAKIPIVAVTSFAMTGDREKALEAGCNGYIEKPIDPETFLSSIARYL